MGAGGAPKYRHLSRNSAHRQALLRNLVTSLFTHESIATTWPKAKEAQRLAEKLITLGKRNTEASRRRAFSIFYRPHEMTQKLFTTIRTRYVDRPGGCTRVLRIEPRKADQAPSALLELVDGPRDMRFALTAQTVARDKALKRPHNDVTKMNVRKTLRYRGEEGQAEMEGLVRRFKALEGLGWDAAARGEVVLGDGRGGGGGRGGFVRKREVYGNTRDAGYFENYSERVV